MKDILSLVITKERIRTSIIDIFAIAFIYFIPTISHLLSLPIFLIEPMRIMIIISLAHTTKRNSYFIALTLPFFSYAISAHPSIFKTILIALELTFNVWLFYKFFSIIKRHFPAILVSILISKLCYYIIKFGLIGFTLLKTPLVSTPIYLQLITTIALSLYIFFILGINKRRYPLPK